MKRKKRLEKGIESIKKQIDIHRQKLEEAREKGADELVDYYERDLDRLEKQKSQKEEKLG